MTGKEKCEFLKEIRKNMAKENGIPYEPRECHHEGYCTGTCPLCEKEAAELLAELKKKENDGEKIIIDTEAIKVLEQTADKSEEIEDEGDEVELLGDISPDYFEKHSLSNEERRLENERLIQEEKYRRALAEAESKPQKLGLFGRLLKKLFNRIDPPLMGEPEYEVGYEIPKKEKTALMGDIPSNQWLNKEVKIEHGPDIIWNMDKEDPVISPSANIKSDMDSPCEKNDDDYVEDNRYFVSRLNDKTVYVKMKNGNESTIIVVREIDGEEIVYDNRYSIDYLSWNDYGIEPKEITEEEFESVFNHQTDIEAYVSRKVKNNDSFYISIGVIGSKGKSMP